VARNIELLCVLPIRVNSNIASLAKTMLETNEMMSDCHHDRRFGHATFDPASRFRCAFLSR